MAASIDAAASSIELRITYTDVRGETARVTLVLDSALTDGDLEALIDHIDALTNSAMTVNIVSVRGVTGLASASSSAQSLVAAFMALDFTNANPINTDLAVHKQVVTPAYLDALYAAGFPVEGNTHLDAIVAGVGDSLVYVGLDESINVGGW